MAKRTRTWVKDVLVFASSSALSLLLTFPCGLVVCDGFPLLDVWFWVLATPAVVAQKLQWSEFATLLFWLNPLIYGLMWWAVWRMFRLMRAKPPEVDTPPSSE